MKNYNEIKDIVKNFFNENAEYTLPKHFIGNSEIESTIISVGTSILCTKLEISPIGGSFVQSIVNNDLIGTISRADEVNIHAIKFYCQLMHNVEIPTTII